MPIFKPHEIANNALELTHLPVRVATVRRSESEVAGCDFARLSPLRVFVLWRAVANVS
jgi:hypothetical protein